jgi:hypothetical protein
MPPNVMTGATAHFIGSFAPPLGNTPFFNTLRFDLDLTTGRISNAGFEFEYKDSGGINPDLWADGGSGQVNPSSWSLFISGFSQSGFHDDWSPTSAVGYLGPNTHISGSLGGPMDFSQTGSGDLYPEYVSTNGYTVSSLLSSYSFAGDLNRKSVVEVEGTFDISSAVAASVLENKFELTLDLNNGDIRTGVINIIYLDSSSVEHDYHIGGGSGVVTNDAFHVTFTDGRYYPAAITLTSATLDGHFDSSSPNIGTLLPPGPGNQLNIVYGSPPPANNLGTVVPIHEGQVIPSGGDLY